MKEKDKIKKLEKSEVFVGETPQIAFKGKNSGKEGLLTRLVFTPNKEFHSLTLVRQNDVVDKTLSSMLTKHCQKIGWWPDRNKKPYTIEKQEDGTYIIISFLKKGVNGVSFDNKGIINVNEK